MLQNIMNIAIASWMLMSGLARGQNLDMTQYRQSFADNFTKPDITAHGGPGSIWIAHTPWNGDFGNDVFDDPGTSPVFTVSPDGLTISAYKDPYQHWHGGLICSMDNIGPAARGFAQQYGYFEMEAKLPDGPGVWPAFWLMGTQRQNGVSEIDVMEYYGHARDEYHITEHYWVNGHDTLGAWHVVTVPGGLLSSRYNDFGVAITAQTVTYYFNGAEVWQTPTPPEYRQPMYILANLAIGGGWPFDQLASPQYLHIRFIHAYIVKQ